MIGDPQHPTNPAYKDKDPVAVEGLVLGLDAVDACLEFLEAELTERINRNAARADQIRGMGVDPFLHGTEIADMAGQSVRWGAQRAMVTGLRDSLPDAILHGHTLRLAGLIRD